MSDTSATFSFSSTESGSTFACSLDGGAFAHCTSPATYSGLADGSHTFTVRATDVAGNTDPTPATATWTISTVVADTTPPDTTITSGPSGTVSDTSATFSFASTESGSTFACSLDGGAFANCTSPASYSGLADGSHTFTVRATDVAGNTDPTPATATWTITTVTPTTPITRESVATTVNSTASPTVTVARPAGTTTGDVLVACLALNGSQPKNKGVPAGWTEIAAVTGIKNPRVFGYYRVAGNAEPNSYEWTLSAPVAAGAGIARYSGVDSAKPLDAPVSTAHGAAAIGGTIPGIPTTTPGAMVVGCMSVNSASSSMTIATPSPMNEVWDIAGKRHEFSDGTQPNAGPTGDETWTFNQSREWAGWLTALKPRA